MDGAVTWLSIDQGLPCWVLLIMLPGMAACHQGQQTSAGLGGVSTSTAQSSPKEHPWRSGSFLVTGRTVKAEFTAGSCCSQIPWNSCACSAYSSRGDPPALQPAQRRSDTAPRNTAPIGAGSSVSHRHQPQPWHALPKLQVPQESWNPAATSPVADPEHSKAQTLGLHQPPHTQSTALAPSTQQAPSCTLLRASGAGCICIMFSTAELSFISKPQVLL